MSNPRMTDLQSALSGVLGRAAKRMREAGLPDGLAVEMERLARQVDDPCVVAVVGRVNAGKSTFINAFLGEDMAAVGTTETTATINYFRFGKAEADWPVRCHWRNGLVTAEDKAFLDGLQGNDIETLQRADGIDHLEYLLPDPRLEGITLVDTPGTGSVIGEHQDRADAFMKLSGRLQARHDQETRRLGEEADAVIYLVGQEPLAPDQAFLEEFARATGGRTRALNAVGVMAQIDKLSPEDLSRRHEWAARVASRLEGSLNTVVPVSAGVQRALDRLDRAGLERLMDALRSIPPDTLEMLLDDEEFFCDEDFEDCPVSIAERRGLRGDAPWGAFATIAREAANPGLTTPDSVEEGLRDIAGFGLLEKVLNQRFVERGHILRCYRIANDARKVLGEIRLTHLPERRRRAREDRARLGRFLAFIQRRGDDPAVADELEDFVRRHSEAGGHADALERLWQEVDVELGMLFQRLAEENADFEALQQLEDHAREFGSEELTELRALLGLHGGEVEKRLPPGRAKDVEYAAQRQLHWQQRRFESTYGSPRYTLADRAFARYGLILDALLNESDNRLGVAGANAPEYRR